MFTKSAADITFSDIEEFCREFGEGERVEYKREIQHIAKIVSSFANGAFSLLVQKLIRPTKSYFLFRAYLKEAESKNKFSRVRLQVFI